MATRNRSPRPRGTSGSLEWVGGVFDLFTPVRDGDITFVPRVAIWAEAETGVVAQKLGPPDDGDGPLLAAALREALERPNTGRRRKPSRLRVATKALAGAVEKTLSDLDSFAPQLIVAPTPEIDALARELEAIAASHASHASGDAEAADAEAALDDEDLVVDIDPFDDLPADEVRALFGAAGEFALARPWESFQSDCPLGVDIPALGVRGACATVLGAAGDVRGFLFFESVEAFDHFMAIADSVREGDRRARAKLGESTFLSFELAHADEITPDVRAQHRANGWKARDLSAYPLAFASNTAGRTRPLDARDLAIVLALTTSIRELVTKEDARLRAGKRATITVRALGVPATTLTAPHVDWDEDAFIDDDSDEAQVDVRSAPPPERNAPCPCGSGKKYKKCHLREDEANRGTARPSEPAASPLHDLDRRVVTRIAGFANDRFGDVLRAVGGVFRDPYEARGLSGPWAIYVHPFGYKTAAEHFRAAEGGLGLAARERAWLDAQSAAWLSVWEVERTDPARGDVVVRDRLTAETRVVHDVGAANGAGLRAQLLARIVDFEGRSVFVGFHPRVLSPAQADDVVRRVQRKLKTKIAVAPDALRPLVIGELLIRAWEDAVEAAETIAAARAKRPPALHNHDGHPIVVTRDVFSFDDAAPVHAGLRGMLGVRAPDDDDPDAGYTFLRHGRPNDLPGGTVIGGAFVDANELVLEANSVERADDLKRAVLAACGGVLRFVRRDQEAPGALDRGRMAAVRARDQEAAPLDPAIARRAVAEMLEEHYQRWLDAPLPALDGATPRQAAKQKRRRQTLITLLRDMEFSHHSGAMPMPPFDFDKLRRELGLGDA